MFFVQQNKLAPFFGRKRRKGCALRGINTACRFCAKLLSGGGEHHKLFTKVIRRRLCFNISFFRKLLYAGINRLLAQIPNLAKLLLGTRPPKLVNSAKNIERSIGKTEFFRKRMI